MMGQIHNLMQRLDALALRERLMVLSGALVVTYFAMDVFLIAPATASRTQFQAQKVELSGGLAGLRVQVELMTQQQLVDPDKVNQDRLASLQKELESVNEIIRAATGELMAPGTMAIALENVLNRDAGMQLLQLQGLGAEQIIDTSEKDNPGANSETGASGIYKHGLRIEFSGGYLQTLAYLRALEKLDWGFFWDSVEFEVLDYPDSRSVLTVFTLSLSDMWIGV